MNQKRSKMGRFDECMGPKNCYYRSAKCAFFGNFMQILISFEKRGGANGPTYILDGFVEYRVNPACARNARMRAQKWLFVLSRNANAASDEFSSESELHVLKHFEHRSRETKILRRKCERLRNLRSVSEMHVCKQIERRKRKKMFGKSTSTADASVLNQFGNDSELHV